MAQSASHDMDKPLPDLRTTLETGRQAFYALRRQAAIDFPNGISLEEINEEIRKVRYDEDSKPTAPTLHP